MTERLVKPGERWTTFIFDGTDCAELGVYAVTSGSTYTTNLAPAFSDKKTTVTAYDGQYYYGTQITGQKFTFNMFAENLTYGELCHLKAWLNPRHIGKLILSDQPYKYYYVKPSSVGAISNIPLSTVQTPERSILGDFLEGDPVYTGKFTITFETVGSAYGYGISYYRNDLVYDALNKYGLQVYPENYYYNSGLLYKDMSPAMEWDIKPGEKSLHSIPMYNPGDAKSYPVFKFTLKEPLGDNAYISFTNDTLDEGCVVQLHNIPAGDVTIDFLSQTVEVIVGKEKKTFYGRMVGMPVTINERNIVITIPDTITQDIEDIYKTEYDTIYIYDWLHPNTKEKLRVAQINDMVTDVEASWIGRYLCINGNGGVKIKDIIKEDPITGEKVNLLILEDEPHTYDIPPATYNQNGTLKKHAGFECRYIQINENLDNLPKEPKLGDIYQYQGKWYIYQYNKWQETGLFSHENDFRDIYGNFIPRYVLFGANILILDELYIHCANMPQFTLRAEILPRYL